MNAPVLPTPALSIEGGDNSAFFHMWLITLPAVYNNWAQIFRIDCHHFPHKVEKGSGVIRHSVVRPGSVLELCHCSLLLRVAHLQGEGPVGVVSQHLDLHNVNSDPAIQLTLIWPVLVTLDLIKQVSIIHQTPAS